jgi:hypothetical protein
VYTGGYYAYDILVALRVSIGDPIVSRCQALASDRLIGSVR